MKSILPVVISYKRIVVGVLIGFIIFAFVFRPKQAKPIETQTVKRGEIVETLSANGSIDSLISVDLNFISSGKLVYLGARKGDFVKTGQTIATLDQRTLQNSLQTALRNYSEQRNSFDQRKENNLNNTPKDE